MAHRGGARRTATGCRHPRVSVPELSAPCGRPRCPHAHRPLGRAVAIDATGRRRGGSLLVAAAGGRERGGCHPCRRRGHRCRRNADPSALRRPGGRSVADAERSGPRRYRLSEPCGHEHARRGCIDDSGRQPAANRAARHRAPATRSAIGRSAASGRGADTAGGAADTDADTQPDGHTEREPIGPDQCVTVAQREPVARALADGQSEPVLRSRVRAVSERWVDATLVRVLRSSGAQT